jgi:hypothetical protein
VLYILTTSPTTHRSCHRFYITAQPVHQQLICSSLHFITLAFTTLLAHRSIGAYKPRWGPQVLVFDDQVLCNFLLSHHSLSLQNGYHSFNMGSSEPYTRSVVQGDYTSIGSRVKVTKRKCKPSQPERRRRGGLLSGLLDTTISARSDAMQMYVCSEQQRRTKN